MTPELDWLLAEIGEESITSILLACHVNPYELDRLTAIHFPNPKNPSRQIFRKCVRAVLAQMPKPTTKTHH